jgi:hypothetical protein
VCVIPASIQACAYHVPYYININTHNIYITSHIHTGTQSRRSSRGVAPNSPIHTKQAASVRCQNHNPFLIQQPTRPPTHSSSHSNTTTHPPIYTHTHTDRKKNMPRSRSRSSSSPSPPCHYPLLGQITAGLCLIDMLVTTILLLCVKDWWQAQVCLYM